MLSVINEKSFTRDLPSKPRRGRPKRSLSNSYDTRESLLHAGMLVLTQTGFTNSSIDPILKSVGVPKGSFYHYFASKEAFGFAVLESYRRYFESKLDSFLLNRDVLPLERLKKFSKDAQNGMVRHDFKRGCLVGNLEQESTLLSEDFCEQLKVTYLSWQSRVAVCLLEAQQQGQIAIECDIENMAQIFWVGWEGAVHRSRLVKSTQPLSAFLEFFIKAVQSK